MKRIILFLILITIIGISGYIITPKENIKHFDNGTISFDYPENMGIKTDQNGIIIEDNNYIGCNLLFTEYPEESELMNSGTSNKLINFETYMNKYIFEGADIIEKNKIIISGRPAYKVSERGPDGIVTYSTYIDTGAGILTITHNVDATIQDQRTTVSYKAYKTVINSIQIK